MKGWWFTLLVRIMLLSSLVACSATRAPAPHATGTVPAATAQPGVFPAVDPTRPFVLDIRVAHAATWVEITVDGVSMIKGVYDPGWRSQVQPQQEVVIHAGSETDVEVSIQGGRYTPMGQRQNAAGVLRFVK
jgi:hypothetical protein